MDLKIEKVVVGEIKTNCYIIVSANELAVIDPGGEAEKIMAIIEKYKRPKKKYIFLTHSHYDHLLAVADLKKKYGFKIVLGQMERRNYENVPAQAMYRGSYIPAQLYPDMFVLDGDKIAFGEGEIKVMHTPGHSEGSVCYVMGDTIFSGDTLFYHIYGRTDLITGSKEEMNQSLKKLFDLSGSFTVLPGHGQKTNLDSEREYFRKNQQVMDLEF